MSATATSALWDRYRRTLLDLPTIGMRLDVSRMDLPDEWLAKMEPAAKKAFAQMVEIENGAIVNTDEKRMVGHYWLRAPARAPDPAITKEIESTVEAIIKFARDVHEGNIVSERGAFTDLLIIGIGGSSLGPRFVAQALGRLAGPDRLRPHFIDNTDPDGIDRVYAEIGGDLARTLTLVISKSGGTKETRNGMLETAARYRAAGLSFARAAVAVTGAGSQLDQHAKAEGWLATFPMWDWVGGRTSELSAVGLLPAALQGIDVSAMLDGARACDEVTRVATEGPMRNPAMAMALSWHRETNGRGEKDMVILPYKDRLLLFSQYLQQLVMESLGKERDRDGKVVHQGIAVYGNKGSTDQHAYVQQLREGIANFFVTFIHVQKDRTVPPPSIEVEPGVTSGDFLTGFLLGTRRALYENGRRSITLTIDEVTPARVGALIALYERAVGFYASLVNVNAYHQPGVEAGKKAAEAVIELQRRVMAELDRRAIAATATGTTASAASCEELAAAIEAKSETETVFQLLEHLAANPSRGITREIAGDGNVLATRYRVSR